MSRWRKEPSTPLLVRRIIRSRLIVVDDASTDNSRIVIGKLQKTHGFTAVFLQC
ncbi:MAG: hypothetical protein U5K79_03330 [Cyclobacteriaceae bacterium]|nr:hypothetical protein [Cyclobacteriaceae bacterium]